MKVLSIDLDYIMFATEPLFANGGWDNHPMCRWDMFYKQTDYNESDLFHDEARLHYLKNIFLNAIKKCSNVKFGYEHDDIIYYIRDYDSIDLVNIDHHDDVLMGCYDFYTENDKNYEWKNYNIESKHVKKYDKVNEGNWIYWLQSKSKLKKFTWIGNNNSVSDEKHRWIKKNIKSYRFYPTMDYNFGDYDFDHVFLCLSPQYIPPHIWHHFNWFIKEYENRYNIKINPREWETRKIEIDYRYQKVSDAILYECSNDR